jgi:hypothetical protein
VALFILALNDIALYIWQSFKGQKLGEDFSHRWFGDGYVFLCPFLLGRLLSNVCNPKNSNYDQSSHSRFLQMSLYLLLLLTIILAGGTGARSTYGIIFLQILVFCYIKCRQLGLGRVSAFISTALFSILITKVFLGLLAPELFSGTISRRLHIWDRIQYAWEPGIFFISHSPFLGHGFGVEGWNSSFNFYVLSHPNALNFGSTHNWFLAAGFLGGLAAIIAQLVLVIGIILWSCLGKNNNKEMRYWIISLLSSFISFYLFKGLVEFTIYKYLSITLVVIFLINTINNKINLSTRQLDKF